MKKKVAWLMVAVMATVTPMSSVLASEDVALIIEDAEVADSDVNEINAEDDFESETEVWTPVTDAETESEIEPGLETEKTAIQEDEISIVSIEEVPTAEADEETREAADSTDDVIIDDENFYDDDFREFVSENFDLDGDGSLSTEEIANVTKIDFALYDIGNIYSLSGIEYFTELTYLSCASKELDNLGISNNTKLEYLDCSDNQINYLDVSSNTRLQHLDCSDNHSISTLDISNCAELTYLDCGTNSLSNLDVSNNNELVYLNCGSNNLDSLDVSTNTELESLYCWYNKLYPLSRTF